jgi:phosphoglycerate dehydrogenase-like enzyme
MPRANVLFVCLPMTPQTEGLIGEKELNLLPDHSVVVNIARGAIIDEKALYDALTGPRPLRAGLDVWYAYPQDKDSRTSTPPSAYPFHELDNVVMTPHLGGHSDQTETLRITALAELLTCAAEGKPLPNRIDPDRGY